MKQLYERITPDELAAMDARARSDRLALCEHQLTNKAEVLEWMGDSAKPYMVAEVAGLRANIAALKKTL